ncbi:MAG: UvrD-helicase domain-containing protein [Candidatus Omnitrophica bacterium]|nr:UvrD-helicase domain-containing protein [Candidatus Omnitrophota bacterium]
MSFYADLHIHSKYSRATSKDCDLEHLTYWGRKKGITVIGTGDFTHPAWIAEIKDKLVPAEPGLFKLRDDLEQDILKTLPPACHGKTRFMLSVEISTIYKKGDKTRKVHHLIYAPTIAQAEKINAKLGSIGNIRSDGRPILGLDSRHLLEIVLENGGPDCFLVPAHIWTPWFAVLGSKSGFDSIADCYGDLADHVFAVETGLSSDPEMNWRVSGLDRYRLISNSDAHSPAKLGREATIFHSELDYFAMKKSLETGEHFGGTIEFFPEEGKYHMDGHRKCGVRLNPAESRQNGGLCPECHKPLTLGVLYRVEELADRKENEKPENTDDFKNFIPLPEIISETVQSGPSSQKVGHAYEGLLSKLGSELDILSSIPIDDIKNASSTLITEAISRMREGRVIRDAGYDGEYGKIKLFTEKELKNPVSAGVLFDFAQGLNSEKKESSEPKKKALTSENKITENFEGSPKETPGAVLKDHLDSEQLTAVEITDGPLIITAGPGSGKTRTLTHRVAALISEHGVAPEKCLTLTFTRRACEEMRTRLKTLCPMVYKRIPILTFHALGYEIIRENRLLLGLPRSFRVTSDEERQSFLAKALQISTSKAQKLCRAVSKTKRGSSEKDPEVQKALSVFETQKDREGWLDYDDLMLLPCRLLEENAGIQAGYQKRYSWISADEYQDIDALQYRLIRLLTGPKENLCVIGDPDQSIYRFRGADVGFFLKFRRDFKSARHVRLKHNYRSGKTILSASMQMIRPASLDPEREAVALLADTGKIAIHHAPTDRAEAEHVVHAIEQLIGGFSFFSIDSKRSEGDGRNYGFSDFSVLYRTEKQAALLEEAFERSGIPFQRKGHVPFNENPVAAQYLTRLEKIPDSENLFEWFEKASQEILAQNTSLQKNHPVIERLRMLIAENQGERDNFLTAVHLGQDADTWDPRADRVSLLTLHAAKGLEFSVVFITGCEEGLLPLHWGPEISDEDLAEERRLFFVGMTRAKDKLILSHALKRVVNGKVCEQKASPFLKAIEEELVERGANRYAPRTSAKKSQLEMF